MDEDLKSMSHEQLTDEVRKLRHGIRKHRDSSGHDLCWYHPALWSLLPEEIEPSITVPDWPQFMNGCIRYRKSLDEQLAQAKRTDETFAANTPPLIHSICIYVSELERSSDFYQHKIGLKPISKDHDRIEFELGKVSFIIMQRLEGQTAEKSFVRLVLEVSDIKKFSSENSHADVLAFEDPDGNLIEVHQAG